MSYLLTCPNCGVREVTDFAFGGEVSARPKSRPTFRELNTYNYFRRNVAGVQREWWFHRSGCRAWFIAERDTWIATIPIGYADGVNRALTNNCDALIGGRRYPFAGTVSMDNITVDLGPEPAVAVSDEVILIGRSGNQRQTAEDVSRRLDTIAYEVICGISGRVTRAYHRDGAPVAL